MLVSVCIGSSSLIAAAGAGARLCGAAAGSGGRGCATLRASLISDGSRGRTQRSASERALPYRIVNP
jgi:hypothetical protein